MTGGESIPAGRPPLSGDSFVALEIFDPSELPAGSPYTAPEQASEPEIEIPGKFVSDTELQDQLQDSYQRGLQDGKNLAERGLLNVFRGLRTAVEELQLLRDKVLRDSEDELLKLVIAVSRRIIQHEVAQERSVVIRTIKASVQNLKDSDELIIHVHPDDYHLLTTSMEGALKKEIGSSRFTLRADPTLQPGCCQVDTALGTVDATFESQLEEIYRRLLEERASESVDKSSGSVPE